MSDNCLFCEEPRQASLEYCMFHAEIYEAIKHNFRVWSEAYNEELTEREFLKRISNLMETGEESKRVASYLIMSGAKLSDDYTAYL
jgi:hypothetical protein